MSNPLATLLAGISSPYPNPSPTLLGGLYIAPLVPAAPMWIAVTRRFRQFHDNLTLTPLQQLDGSTKRAGVVSALNRIYYGNGSTYYGSNAAIDHSFLVGSWGKNTAVRPPRDVDVYFLLPAAVYHRFQAYAQGRQSALLQDIKDVLAVTYPNTAMRGDGQVVIVNFGSYCVEIVPAFETTNGDYLICDTNAGGRWKTTTPWAEVVHIDTVDAACAQNLRPLIRMAKTWQATCSVPIKSFCLELLAAEFIAQSPWRLKDWFYFDWITRDFFAYLYNRANGAVVVPGTLEVIQLGSEWQSRALSAYQRAVKACDHERDNQVAAAGDEWQKIFGCDIPRVL
jgi:hypothetical protein